MASPTAAAATIRAKPVGDDSQQKLLYKSGGALATGIGLGGVDWVTDTANRTGEWWIFHAVSDSVIDSITYKAGTSSGTPAGLTLKAGDRIYGFIVAFRLASGSGELYRPAI